MINIHKILIFIFLLLFLPFVNFSQNRSEIVSIGFYNLENLFDTEDDPSINDEEFLPNGGMKWTESKYKNKLSQMALSISRIGDNIKNGHPVVLGVSEIENRRVLEDLIATEPLAKQKWGIIHYNSPDRRGIDVALLYQKNFFSPRNIHPYHYTIKEDTSFKTRDQLLVSGILIDEEIHFIVNHWPSRRGGELKSRPKRNGAAKLTRHITDSILRIDPNAKVVIMGDLNDDPINQSVLSILNTSNGKSMTKKQLFNPMLAMHKAGIGSLAYFDNWNLFDQIIISQGLYKPSDRSFQYKKAYVYNADFLLQKEGRYKGYPLRTHAGGAYLNGFSDHFPVFMLLKREAKH